MSYDDAANFKRQEILRLARKLASDGAHYLWGAEGLMPARGSRAFFAPVMLNPAYPRDTTFCAAKLRVEGVDYVCAGRCMHSDLIGVDPEPKLVSDPEHNATLLAFIEKYRDNSTAQYGWGFQLTPRKVLGKEIMDYRHNTLISENVVWGEGCDETLHFDCGGLVRYVVKQLFGFSITGISMLPNPSTMKNPWGGPVAQLVKSGETILPADIVVYEGHIGFATGEEGATFGSTDAIKLAQAESATEGVNYNKVHKGKPTKIIRLSTSTLVGQGYPLSASGD